MTIIENIGIDDDIFFVLSVSFFIFVCCVLYVFVVPFFRIINKKQNIIKKREIERSREKAEKFCYSSITANTN